MVFKDAITYANLASWDPKTPQSVTKRSFYGKDTFLAEYFTVSQGQGSFYACGAQRVGNVYPEGSWKRFRPALKRINFTG
jgi:hypothetical protein